MLELWHLIGGRIWALSGKVWTIDIGDNGVSLAAPAGWRRIEGLLVLLEQSQVCSVKVAAICPPRLRKQLASDLPVSIVKRDVVLAGVKDENRY